MSIGANRFIGGGKAGDFPALQGAYLYRPAGNRSREGHPQGWKAQTRREWQTRWHGEQTGRWTYRVIPELATWLNRKHGEVGFYLAQALSGHGCFNAFLRRFKKRDEEICCYCETPVDNAEHALFVCAKWGVAREAIGR